MEFWSTFWIEVQEVLQQGGFVLWIMLVLSVILYAVVTATLFGLFQLKQKVPNLSSSVELCTSENDVMRQVEIFELEELAWVERRFPVIAVLIALAPLSGLLGTVSGMLNTFAGLNSQAAVKPIDSISSGISEALVTTQAGLFMAIPAAFLFVGLKSITEKIRGNIEQRASIKLIELKGALS